MDTKVSPAARLLQWWNRLKKRPGGKFLFGRILSRGIPYTGTIHPRILIVEPGHAQVQMRDRRAVRNHLRSVHAIAITNLGELTTGLAMTASLAPEIRSILTGLRVEFQKKARGTLTAECRCAVPHVLETIETEVTGQVRDEAGDVVATITAKWRLSPTAD